MSVMSLMSADDKLKKHYVSPDMYQVTWWPGAKAESNINSQSTTGIIVCLIKSNISSIKFNLFIYLFINSVYF